MLAEAGRIKVNITKWVSIMNRDFEFQQLLRAYRKGIISEAAFEREMANLESESQSNAAGFRVMGKTYPSEREAILSYLRQTGAGEAQGAEGFSRWLAVCKTDCIRSGLRMIAEREAAHARVMEHRARELGAEGLGHAGEGERKFVELVSNPNMPDNEKLLRLTSSYDPEDLWRPVREFVDLIKEDLQSKELIRLYVEDETSSGNWLRDACKALNAPAQAAAQSSMTAS